MGVEAEIGEGRQHVPGDAVSRNPTRRIAFGAFRDWEPSIRATLDPRYAADFIALDAVELGSFDAVVPLRIQHYAALAARPDLFGRKFIHPAPEVVALCHDKLALTRFLVANGFGAFTPALRAPGPPYPYIWKRRRSAWGRDCYVVTGPEEEGSFDFTDQNWFAQALASGPVELATHMLRFNGELRYVATIVYRMAGPTLVRGQNHTPVSAQFSHGCPFQDLLASILVALDYQGTACFNYKIADDGRPLIFEINPRYGASLNIDVTAYVDAYLNALNPESPARV
jgi:hypothetical protein